MKTPHRYRSRKFLLSAFSLLAGAIGMYTGHMDAAQFVALTGVVLAGYGAANVLDSKTEAQK